MTFQDIFKSSFLENIATISILDMVIAMVLAFLFWAIAVGIVLAAGLIPLAVFGSIFIGVVLFAFSRKKTADFPYTVWN